MKKGAKGDTVKQLQYLLNIAGSLIKVDSDFGRQTENAVWLFQKQNKLPDTGEADAKTVELLLAKAGVLKCAEAYFLSPDNYVTSNPSMNKRGVCLHHTAGGGDAKRVADVWQGDSRGRVGTHFVIGADGQIIQCVPMQNFLYHIAATRTGFGGAWNNSINKNYVGIEICNWGYLEPNDIGNLATYTGKELPASEVCVLAEPFRTYTHWQKYTKAQLAALRVLLIELKEVFGFDYRQGAPEPSVQWFDMSWLALAQKRTLTTHTNFEYGKADCYPAPELIQLLKTV